MNKSISIQDIMSEISDNIDTNQIQGEVLQGMECLDGYIPTMQDMMEKTWGYRKENSIHFLLGHSKVEYYREINNNVLITFIKRFLRKAIKFCVYPIVEDQNANNANILQVLNAQNQEIKELKREIEKLNRLYNNFGGCK